VTALKGKIALITGGNRNIGRESALALAAKGADIVITYREQKDSAAKTVADLTALGVKAAALQVNLTGTEQLDALVEQLKANTAVARVGVPKDIGEVIAFLCSPEASFVSGAVVNIDGGYHL
jgi:NAD(P)-dependent dehydrogenase (short-subunit alcohol dehydrogenase family)